MKAPRSFLFLFLLAGGLSSTARAADISTTTIRSQITEWSFIQAAGGLQLGLPIQVTKDSWKLPLACDLSGKETFTQKPTAQNTGVVIHKIDTKQEGKDILISILATQSVWTLNADRCVCTPVTVDSEPGLHQVFYRDAVGKTFPLGFVEFNKDSNVLNNPG